MTTTAATINDGTTDKGSLAIEVVDRGPSAWEDSLQASNQNLEADRVVNLPRLETSHPPVEDDIVGA